MTSKRCFLLRCQTISGEMTTNSKLLNNNAKGFLRSNVNGISDILTFTFSDGGSSSLQVMRNISYPLWMALSKKTGKDGLVPSIWLKGYLWSRHIFMRQNESDLCLLRNRLTVTEWPFVPESRCIGRCRWSSRLGLP